MRGCSRRVDSSFLAGLITGRFSMTWFRVQGRFTLHANSPSFGLRFLWQISLCVCVSPGNPFVLSLLRLLFFFCRVVEQFLYSSVCTSPRLRLHGPFRCLLYLYPFPVGYRNWKSSQGHFVFLSFTPSLCRSSIPCKDKRYLVFYSSFLSFLFFLLSFLFFLSFRPCLKTCKKKKKLHLSFFSVLNFSAWSISNVLIFFSLLLIFFFNWILSF